MRNSSSSPLCVSSLLEAPEPPKSQPTCRVLFFNGRVAKDGFQLEEFFESGHAPFASVARLFVAPKTTSEIQPRAIDVHVARSNSFCNPTCALEVARRHIA